MTLKSNDGLREGVNDGYEVGDDNNMKLLLDAPPYALLLKKSKTPTSYNVSSDNPAVEISKVPLVQVVHAYLTP